MTDKPLRPKSESVKVEKPGETVFDDSRRIKRRKREKSTPDEEFWGFKYKPKYQTYHVVESHAKGTVQIDSLNSEKRARVRKIAKVDYPKLATQYGIKKKHKDVESRIRNTIYFKNKIITDMKARLARRRAEEPFGADCAFGVKMKTMMELEKKHLPDNMNTRLPLVLKILFDHLDKKASEDNELISKESGDSSAVTDVMELMSKDVHKNLTAIKEKLEASSPKVAGEILLLYLKALPETLFSSDAFYALCQILNIPDGFDRMKAIRMLMLQLSDVKMNVLIDLIRLFKKIAKGHIGVVKRLANAVGPVIFGVPNAAMKDQDNSPETKAQFRLIRLMIDNEHLIFAVPRYITYRLKPIWERNIEDFGLV